MTVLFGSGRDAGDGRSRLEGKRPRKGSQTTRPRRLFKVRPYGVRTEMSEVPPAREGDPFLTVPTHCRLSSDPDSGLLPSSRRGTRPGRSRLGSEGVGSEGSVDPR